MQPNVISPITMWSYEYLTCYLKDHNSYVSITVTITITFWLNSCVRSAQCIFGKMMFGSTTIRENGIRLNDDSRERYSAKWRFGKMAFGWMMCRETDVRLNTYSRKWYSTLYSFGNFTIREYDDSTNWHSTTWHFGKIIWPQYISVKMHQLIAVLTKKALRQIQNAIRNSWQYGPIKL